MKILRKNVLILSGLVLCFSCVGAFASPSILPRDSDNFISYDVYIPSSMEAEFQVTTRKPVASVSISATLQVQTNGVWKNVSTGVSPAFSGSNSVGWTTTAEYADYCKSGSKYRLVVYYTANGEKVSYTSNSRTY